MANRATAAFDAEGKWASDGARSAPAWIAVSCRVPKGSASRRLHPGRCLRHLPALISQAQNLRSFGTAEALRASWVPRRPLCHLGGREADVRRWIDQLISLAS